MQSLNTLRSIGSMMVLAALLAGGVTVWLWSASTSNWRAHGALAYEAGVTLYYAMQNGTAPPEGVQMRVLDGADLEKAERGAFRQIEGAPSAPRITMVPILPDAANLPISANLTMAILSPDLKYSLADLPHRDGQTAAETLGAVTRKLATFCSDPFVVAKMGQSPWVAIDGDAVWGCDASPADYRYWPR